MRNTIVNLIHEQAKANPNVYFLNGDLGYSVVEKIMAEFPERAINMAIAEQNMMSAAAGLALEGKKVFVYSIAPFVTMRTMEQVRTDVALQNVDVTIVAVGGGFAYGTLGPTHYAIEEVGMMRAIPNMKILCPCDKISAGILGKQALAMRGPLYIRLNRGGEPDIYQGEPKLSFGKGSVLKEGNEVSIFSHGAVTAAAMEAAKLLERDGISAEVVDMATIKPLDEDIIKERAKSRKVLATVEEHNIIGGLGSAVAEVLAETLSEAKFKRFGVPDKYPEVFGNQDYMRGWAGLSAQNIADGIKGLQ